MFKAVLLIIAKRWKQPKHPSINEWIVFFNILSLTHEYYSAIKRNEMLTHVKARMKLQRKHAK